MSKSTDGFVILNKTRSMKERYYYCPTTKQIKLNGNFYEISEIIDTHKNLRQYLTDAGIEFEKTETTVPVMPEEFIQDALNKFSKLSKGEKRKQRRLWFKQGLRSLVIQSLNPPPEMSRAA